MMEAIFGLAAFGLPLLQGSNQHGEALRQANTQHNQGIAQAALQHKQSLALDLELSRREMLTQYRDQRGNQVESVMLMDTLMLGTCFSLMVEGELPEFVDQFDAIIFMIFLGIAMSSFFISIWLLLRVRELMTRYNIINPNHVYICGKKHPSFTSFFVCHCATPLQVGTWAYASGMVFIMCTACTLMLERFQYLFEDVTETPAYIFAAILVTAGFVSVVLLPRIFPSGPNLDEAYEKDEYVKLALKRRMTSRNLIDDEPSVLGGDNKPVNEASMSTLPVAVSVTNRDPLLPKSIDYDIEPSFVTVKEDDINRSVDLEDFSRKSVASNYGVYKANSQSAQQQSRANSRANSRR